MSHLPIAFQPRHMSIELYPASQFITAHDWTYGRDGNVNPVLHGQFSTPAGEYFDGFAKPFTLGDAFESTTMLNEVTGWLIAKACGLPVPQRAFFIPLNIAELPQYAGAAPLPRADNSGQVLSFVTQSVANTAIRAAFDTNVLIQEQAEWNKCDDTITFDEGVANADRHAFNLLRRAAGDFVLIDHGFLLLQDGIPYPSHWNNDFLFSHVDHSFSNRLHNNAYAQLSRTSPTVRAQGCQKSVAFFSTLEAAVRATMFEISFWSSKLLPGLSADWLRFLYIRTKQAQLGALMAKRYGVLELNNA